MAVNEGEGGMRLLGKESVGEHGRYVKGRAL
jgi:hypothetical protein